MATIALGAVPYRFVAKNPADAEKKLVEKIKQLGYRVRRPGKYVKVTHFAHEDTLKEFRAVAERQDFRLQEAITEAMELWLEKHRS